MYKKRLYRTNTFNSDLVSFQVKRFESDLLIYAHSELSILSFKYLQRIHGQVSDYCQNHPEFEKSLEPVDIANNSPRIIKIMHKASIRAGVGPMATVAGAIAESVGKKLLKHSKEIIIENGGDIFIAVSKTRKVGIFAGIGNVYNQLIIKINPAQSPCGICTSSGQFGHSLSLGNTCATIILAKSSALADGYATAFGNIVNSDDDIDFALKSARRKKTLRVLLS